MEDKKISVIVPIYKVEDYLDRCVETIVNQTYSNLEIILVDDGSPDNCPKMCDNWAQKDNRIKVIHKTNGGLSDARNAGLEIATGELIAFIDSDDWVSLHMFEDLLKAMDETNADVIECNYKYVYEGDEVADISYDEQSICAYNAEQALKELLSERKLKNVVWNKLYTKEIIGDIRFEVGKIHEDVFFTYQILGKAKCVAKLEEELYYYLQRNDSIMGVQFSLKNLSSLEAKSNMVNYFRSNYPSLLPQAEISLYFGGIYLGQRALLTKDKELINTAFKTILGYVKPIKIELSKLDFKFKIWYILSKISFKICCKVRNLLKNGL